MAYIEKRESENGKTAYRAMIRLKGYPTETATFDRLTDARDWAQKTEAAMKERRYFKTVESKKHTVADMIARYITRVEQRNPKRMKDLRPMLQWWKNELGYCILADLTKSLLTEKIEKLTSTKHKLKDGTEKSTSAARVNRHIAALSHAFTIAVNEWEWLEHHPLHKVAKLKEPRGRVRFLDDDERAALMNACKESQCPYLYMIVTLALSTGARFNEIMSLKWSDVDITRKAIILHDTKNNERRVLPLAGHALDLFKDHSKIRRIDSALVFPSLHDAKKPFNIRTSWNTAVKNAKLQNFKFHDLRHSAASYLAMNGASLAEIAEVLGHKTLQMVKRYAHLSEAHTSKVVASMNKKIFG